MEKEYKVITGIESHGGSLSFGVKILAWNIPDVDWEATPDLYSAFDEAMDKIKDAIQENFHKHNPDSQANTAQQKRMLAGCFDSPIYMEPIPNGYCSRACCKHLPWYNVTTRAGVFTIGWRKRVINIDWSKSLCEKDSDVVFPEVTDTKGDGYIHAYSYEDAKNYITRLMNSLS